MIDSSAIRVPAMTSFAESHHRAGIAVVMRTSRLGSDRVLYGKPRCGVAAFDLTDLVFSARRTDRLVRSRGALIESFMQMFCWGRLFESYRLRRTTAPLRLLSQSGQLASSTQQAGLGNRPESRARWVAEISDLKRGSVEQPGMCATKRRSRSNAQDLTICASARTDALRENAVKESPDRSCQVHPDGVY